ncbi:MAG: OB-fold domain-containing protein [Microthrixaceae bacterium]
MDARSNAGDTADRSISEMPTGLWSQPEVAVPGGGDSEQVMRITVPATLVYDYTPGAAPTRFLRGLQQGKILGERAAGGTDVYVPSRGMDPVLGRATTESVEVGPKATITTFCVVHIGFGENAPTPPFVSALILPDGAAVSLYGTVLGIDHTEVRIGMRVQPVWKDPAERANSFENITHWEPIDEPDVPAEQLKGHM